MTAVILIAGSVIGFPSKPASPSGASPANEQSAILVGAGDIADCKDLAGAEATAKLLVQIPGTVFAAGDPKTGYYSYELGTWHIIVLNSECKDVGGCEAGSPQEKWLRADLTAHPAACTLAYWHKPLFSSGGAHGNDLTVKPLFQALFDNNADVVIGGHDHDYERFAPQTPDGTADPKRGIREFVVGTGGKNHRPFGSPKPNSELRDATAFGILRLTLKPNSYDWQFIPEERKSFTDSGSGACH